MVDSTGQLSVPSNSLSINDRDSKNCSPKNSNEFKRFDPEITLHKDENLDCNNAYEPYQNDFNEYNEFNYDLDNEIINENIYEKFENFNEAELSHHDNSILFNFEDYFTV